MWNNFSQKKAANEQKEKVISLVAEMNLLARLLRDLSNYINRASIIVGATLFDTNVATL